MPHNIAILGASGYTGAELVRLISVHPSFRIVALSGDPKAGQRMSEVYPHLRFAVGPDVNTDDVHAMLAKISGSHNKNVSFLGPRTPPANDDL